MLSFFVNLSIGTPPQILRVQIDTGSTDLVVFATGCSECPSAENVTYFNPGKSKTQGPIECDDDRYDCDVNNCWQDDYCPLEIQYGGGGSINGYAATDVIELGGLKTSSGSMGLIQEISGPFENLGIDGCWGFAFQGLSSWGDTAVIEHMVFDNKLYDSFSLCLTPHNPVMDIGVNYQGNASFEWTKVDDSDWYTIEMEDIAVNGVSLGISSYDLNANGVIADSGTTLFIVSQQVMSAIQMRFISMCSHTLLVGVCSPDGKTLFDGFCFPMTHAQVAQFPNITTTLQGTHPLIIPPQAYLWEGVGEAGVYCLGLEVIPEADGPLPLILGDVVLQSYHVVFDNSKDMLGWGPLSGCPTV